MNELAKFNLTRKLPFTKFERTSLSKMKLVLLSGETAKKNSNMRV